MIYEEREKYSCDVCGNVPDDDGMIDHGRGCFVVNEDGGGISYVEFEDRPIAVLVDFHITHDLSWYQVPTRNDTQWIASGKCLPFYELFWLSYLTTVRDLMSAGF